MTDRILGLTENIGFETTHRLMGAAITIAMENLNLSKPLTATQIVELVDAIIDTASEDALALEDLILFLQKLTRGEYADTNSRMDIPVFMRLFEYHRQQRYRTLKGHDYEQEVLHKSLGAGKTGNVEINRDEDPANVLDLMQTLYDKKKEEE